MSSVATENFVRFDQPITVSKKFFIAYHLVGKDPDSDFTVYNTQPVNAKTTHTAWINRDGKWIRSNEHSTQPVSASLAIQALLSYTDVPTPPGEIRQIRYIRSQRLLILPNATEVGGQLTLYTVGGQLIQRLPIAERQTAVTLHPQAGGAVAIVRIIRGNDIYTGKLIY
jgi:hypothetical protein